MDLEEFWSYLGPEGLVISVICFAGIAAAVVRRKRHRAISLLVSAACLAVFASAVVFNISVNYMLNNGFLPNDLDAHYWFRVASRWGHLSGWISGIVLLLIAALGWRPKIGV